VVTATVGGPKPGGSMLKYSHPDLALLMHYWPLMVFLPLVLLAVVSLATVTHFWDQRDEEERRTRPPSPES
jgi:hypothetical protein